MDNSFLKAKLQKILQISLRSFVNFDPDEQHF